MFLLTVWLFSLTGCDKQPPSGKAVPFDSPRLITFSPALTQMAFDLGLGNHIVGVTRYCQLPTGQTRPVVGDTLNIRVEPILAVQPDIILSQTESQAFEPVVRVRPELKIEHFRIETLADIGAALERIAVLTGQPQKGLEARHRFENTLNEIKAWTSALPPKKVLFIMGYDTPSGPGRNTFIDEMITLAGGQNILHDQFTHWKRPSLETVLAASVEVIICQCEARDQEQSRNYWQQFTSGKAQVHIITDINWTIPAGHLADLTAQLAGMIHPELATPTGEGNHVP